MIDPAEIQRQTGVAKVHFIERTRSTNDWALETALKGKTAIPAIFFALEQTAGRGRGNKTWVSTRGSLAFSLLVQRPLEVDDPRHGLIALATADAACQYLEEEPGLPAGIKWPNDIMLRDGKLGGILIESAGSDLLVIGCGINARNSVTDVDGAISLRDVLASPPEVPVALTGIALRILRRLETLPEQCDQILRRCQRRDWLAGKALRWDSGTQSVIGIASGFSEDGGLILQIRGESGTHVVRSGCVTVLAEQAG